MRRAGKGEQKRRRKGVRVLPNGVWGTQVILALSILICNGLRCGKLRQQGVDLVQLGLERGGKYCVSLCG